ncbi:MAG: hypothetical protein ACPG4J_02095 [Lentibacter algarum]
MMKFLFRKSSPAKKITPKVDGKMDFEIIDEILPLAERRTGSTVKLQSGKSPALTCYISAPLLKRAKITVGDRLIFQLAKRADGQEFLVLRAASEGYALLSTKSSKSANDMKGSYGRGLVKTTQVKEWMIDHFADRRNYEDDEVQVGTGIIGFPIKKKKSSGLFGG